MVYTVARWEANVASSTFVLLGRVSAFGLAHGCCLTRSMAASTLLGSIDRPLSVLAATGLYPQTISATALRSLGILAKALGHRGVPSMVAGLRQ